MKKTIVAVFVLSGALSISAVAQSTSANVDASGSSKTSASANRSGAGVQSDSSVNASGTAQTAHPGKQHHSVAKAGATASGEATDSATINAASTGQTAQSAALTSGTTVNAILSKSLDSRNCKPGDQVVAKAAADVKSEGKVVIPRGSKLIGHVTEARTRANGEANSAVGIVFDHAVLKSGQQVQMNSVVQAIAAAHASAPGVETDSMMNSSAGMAAQSTGAVRSTGGGLVNAVGSTAGAATGTLSSVSAGATSTIDSTASIAGGVGHNAAIGSTLNSSSTGVIGLKNLSLATDSASSTSASVITSTGKSVRLDSGTQMMLRVVEKQ